MHRNNQKVKKKEKQKRMLLTLFLTEHLIWSLGNFLTGTWVCLSIRDLLIGLMIRSDFRIGMWIEEEEEEQVTAIDFVKQEEEAEEEEEVC